MKLFYRYMISLFILLLTGCSSIYVKEPLPTTIDINKLRSIHTGESENTFVKVPILLATDRKINVNANKLIKIFQNNRGNGEIHYSEVNVSIPKSHTIGELDKKSLWKLEFVDDPAKHMMIFPNPFLLDRQSFYNVLKNRLLSYSDGDIIIFIHGFNNNIEDAVLRTAQISYDLETISNKQFIPMTYSWPSKNKIGEYLTDYEAAEWSVPHLKEFLLDVYANSNGRNINVIVHSMGNQVFAKALSELFQEKKDIKLNQVILAAPDIDAKIFMDNIVPAIENSTNRTTVYMSNEDKAIFVSEKIRLTEPRLGRHDKGLKDIINSHKIQKNKLNFISVPLTNFSSLLKLNHSYFAQDEIVIRDISNAISNKTVDERINLTKDSWLYYIK